MAIRKDVLRRRGALATGALRAPGAKLDAVTIAALDRVLAWVHSSYPMKMEASK
jgi:4-hydroxy-tetrahydrodipicolinate synthase